ncbi:MAG: GNAT family N-acetyltransferase [Thermomicrobiales bacterium]|nr:GNAT family N-acetyltransferase [Thermomicrobiales bacterium]
MNTRTCSDADLPRVLDLLLVCERAGYVDMELRSTELRLTLTISAFDRQRHSRLIEESGRLVAFALLWQGRYLGMLVHPNTRGTRESQIIAWAEGQVRAADIDRLIILCRSDDDLLRTIVQAHGYAIGGEELRMTRPLDTPPPQPTLPDGFRVRTLRMPDELDAWLALYEEAFGRREAALRKWHAFRADPDYDPLLDLVIVDSDDQIAAACTCSIAHAELAAIRPREGRTEPVMVSERYRGLGLGRAAVLAGLSALRARDIEVAALTTEPDNPIAHRLYASLGYEVSYRALWYQRQLDDRA